MTWQPLRASGLAFDFEGSDSFASVQLGPDSILRGDSVGGTPGSCLLTLESAAAIRVTVLGYQDDSISDPAVFTWQPGSVKVVNGNPGPEPASFLPAQFEVGPATSLDFRFGFVEQAGSFQFLIEVQVEAEPAMAQCDEIGRVSRAFVSAHNRTRVHGVAVSAGERRCVVADYNGALPVGRSIAAVEWRLSGAGVAGITDAAIPTARQTQVQLLAQRAGRVVLRCLATLDNGEVYVQSFMVEVSRDPFVDQVAPVGSLVLTAVAA